MTAEELYLANERLAYWVLAKYYSRRQMDEDLQQIAKLGLWKACVSFKEDSGFTFSSYASRVMLNELSNYFRDASRTCRDNYSDISLSTIVSDDGMTLEMALPGDMDVQFMDFNGFWKSLTSKEKKIVKMLMNGFTNREIGKITGVSGQRISEIRLKAKQKFLNCI